MKKKGVLKNSQYYYKKSENWGQIRYLLIGGAIAMIGFVTFVGITTKNYNNNMGNLREESGYTAYIQDELDYLDLQYDNNEISPDYYKERSNYLLHNNFEKYLEEQDDQKSLAKLKEYDKKSLNNPAYLFGSIGGAMGVTLGFEGAHLLNCAAAKRKGKKLEKKENQSFIEIDI